MAEDYIKHRRPPPQNFSRVVGLLRERFSSRPNMSGRDAEALPHVPEWANGTHEMGTLNPINGHVHQPVGSVFHDVESVPEALFRRRHIQFLVICIYLINCSLMSRSIDGDGSFLRNGAASCQIRSGLLISLLRLCRYGGLCGDG